MGGRPQTNVKLAGNSAFSKYPGKRSGIDPRAQAESAYKQAQQNELNKRFGSRF